MQLSLGGGGFSGVYALVQWMGAFIKNEHLFWILEVHLALNAYSE